MNQIQRSNVIKVSALKLIWMLICGLSLLLGCVKETTPISSPTATDLSIQKPEGKQALDGQDSLELLEQSATQCRVDTTGLVDTSVDTQRLKKIRESAWARELTLNLSPDWLALLPSVDQFTNAKVVSFEMSVGSIGGRLHRGAECVRWRLLSASGVTDTEADVVRVFGLRPTPAGSFVGGTDVGYIEVNVGTNGQSVTQVDFALVPSMPVSLQIPFGVHSPVLIWLRSQSVKAFEYGLYVSGRRGLKFPGFERAVLVTTLKHKQLETRLKSAQFLPDEKDKKVYVNGARTVTARSYTNGSLSVFWQSRLSAEDTAPRLKNRP